MDKRLTREEAIAKHREMWEWLAETGAQKHRYFTECKRYDEEIPLNYCYLCEYDNENDHLFCGEYCILEWNGADCMQAEYQTWDQSFTSTDRKFWAEKIYNLPEREVTE